MTLFLGKGFMLYFAEVIARMLELPCNVKLDLLNLACYLSTAKFMSSCPLYDFARGETSTKAKSSRALGLGQSQREPLQRP